MPQILIAIIALILSPLAEGAELAVVTWPTRHSAAPPDFGAQGNAWLPAFRLALGTLPESSVTALALTQPASLGLSAEQARTLLPLVTERYRLMAAAPVYGGAHSALPYCYAAERPAQGFANLYVPAGASSSTPVILFLHGYGGSFLWYQHWLSETFPDHIILCPAYGVSAGLVPPEYLSEAMAASTKRLGFPLGRPCLIGLSAGGFGACRVFVREPGKFRQLICLAAYPTDDTLRQFPLQPPARFLAGAVEPFVSSGDLSNRVLAIRQRSPQAELRTVPKADHFFLLTHPAETRAILRNWERMTAAAGSQ
jgi:pimeloyl-ACP methyl ester carboxylesterase